MSCFLKELMQHDEQVVQEQLMFILCWLWVGMQREVNKAHRVLDSQ